MIIPTSIHPIRVNLNVSRCGDLEDVITLDIAECDDPNPTQWRSAGVISFADLEAAYQAAAELRS